MNTFYNIFNLHEECKSGVIKNARIVNDSGTNDDKLTIKSRSYYNLKSLLVAIAYELAGVTSRPDDYDGAGANDIAAAIASLSTCIDRYKRDFISSNSREIDKALAKKYIEDAVGDLILVWEQFEPIEYTTEQHNPEQDFGFRESLEKYCTESRKVQEEVRRSTVIDAIEEYLMADGDVYKMDAYLRDKFSIPYDAEKDRDLVEGIIRKLEEEVAKCAYEAAKDSFPKTNKHYQIFDAVKNYMFNTYDSISIPAEYHKHLMEAIKKDCPSFDPDIDDDIIAVSKAVEMVKAARNGARDIVANMRNNSDEETASIDNGADITIKDDDKSGKKFKLTPP